ncbi:MAG TPA: hypothetical protein VFL92_04805 [Sphingomonas sp.]|nr:hypothetical protein [Sphingomonas sp.]
MKVRLLWPLILLSGCHGGDWRAQAIAHAEAQMRVEVNDPNASFSRVQFTGDATTGQTCGFVKGRAGAEAPEKTGRFIVYIDETAGPFVEAGMGTQFMSQQAFESAWRADCVREGYTS